MKVGMRRGPTCPQRVVVLVAIGAALGGCSVGGSKAHGIAALDRCLAGEIPLDRPDMQVVKRTDYEGSASDGTVISWSIRFPGTANEFTSTFSDALKQSGWRYDPNSSDGDLGGLYPTVSDRPCFVGLSDEGSGLFALNARLQA
jgi:hypothetical protein